IGRFGPYLLHDGKYANLGGDDDVLEIGINRAVTVIADAAERRGNRGSAPAGKEIGKHPEDSEPVTLHSGRYGPYVKHGKLLASLPRGAVAEEFTLDQAVALIAEKGKVPGGGRKAATKTPKAKAGTKAPAPKTAAKSKTAAKTTKSKSTASKATGSKTSGSKTSSKKGATSKPPESSAAD
ncbi:MAG: topoisomerase C-terminal repeat-containing protein, partial [Pseudomonadota bacterium]